MAKNPKIDQALGLYKQGHKLVEIAAELEVPEGTVRRWSSTYGWAKSKASAKASKSPSDKLKKRAISPTAKQKVRKPGGQPGNKNATGPPGNRHGEKHGFYTKFLPDETVEIIQETQIKPPLDLLWEQICLANAAIVRAQRLGFAKMDESESEADRAKAWMIHSDFLKAQARAQAELRVMIKQYDEMLHQDWELATEEQKARLLLLQHQISDSAEQTDKVVIINDTDRPDQ